MQVLTPGHKYIASNFENPINGQTIQFIEKAPNEIAGEPMVLVNDGTTNEELLAVLIDRIKFLNDKFPCRENEIALTHTETALLWLNKRTADRKARNVEGVAAL